MDLLQGIAMRFTRLLVGVVGAVSVVGFSLSRHAPPCAADNAGLKLPPGFCATLFADSLASPRHMDVASNGDLFVAVRSIRNPNAASSSSTAGGSQSADMIPGGVVILRDENGDGRADARKKIGSFNSSEVKLLGNSLYTETTDAILRYQLKPGSMEVLGAADTIVRDMPATGNHRAKTFVIQNGRLLVNHGSATNACQEKDRAPGSKGVDPCIEITERAGIWAYSAQKKGQTPKDGEHYATGIRNSVAMAVEPRTNDLFVMQHGRDQLDNFPPFTTDKNAIATAEELFHVTRGSDFGWPYCYFDLQENKKVLSPEYGGDGKTVGRCEGKGANVGTFPAHWAPETLLFYTGKQLPERYRNGAFVVFHGSWNRSPQPQEGFRVVFQPMTKGRASGDFETFVDGFVDAATGKPTELGGRPMGMAQGRNGELYLSDDSKGRVWRIQYVGK
jgi:glucose/arabinose dehydrogenase